MKTELVHKVIWVSLCLLIFVSKVDAGSLRDINNILLAEQNIREDNPQLGQLVETFLKNQKRVVDFQSSGLDNNEYLRLIRTEAIIINGKTFSLIILISRKTMNLL